MPLCFSCALCRKDFQEGDAIFSTWGVFLPPGDPLWRYCDACLHWTCYETWNERPRFAEAYFNAWLKHDRAAKGWRILDESQDHFLSANLMFFGMAAIEILTGREASDLVADPDFAVISEDAFNRMYAQFQTPENEFISRVIEKGLADRMTPDFWLYIRETGSRIDIPVADWDTWVSDISFAGENCYPLEKDAIGRILPSLQANAGTLQQICLVWFRSGLENSET